MSRVRVASLFAVRVIEQELVIPRDLGPDPETARIFRRGHVRVVSVEVVQEGEKGAISLPAPQPVEKGVVDPARIAGLEVDPLLVVEIAASEDVLEDPASGDRAAQEETRRQRVILVMGEAPIQPGLVTAAAGVRREPGGLIAPRGQILGQGGIRRIEGVIPLGIELVRPLAGEEAAMRGVRPGGWRQGQAVTDALPGPPREVWGGVAADSRRGSGWSADGVPDDQHDVARARRRRRQSGSRAVLPDRLATGRKGRQDDQQADKPARTYRPRRGCRTTGQRPRR